VVVAGVSPTARRAPFLAASAALAALVLASPGAGRAATPEALGYEHGVVATDNRLASLAGLELLQAGGNAVDAACAAAFALGVVSPTGSGLGGGGFLLALMKGEKRARVLDFRETAPGAARRDLFASAGSLSEASRIGGLAVATPGELRGCAEAVRRLGRRPLAQVLGPAIRLARQGFRVGLHLARTTARLKDELAREPALARLLLPGGRPLATGALLVRADLARTLERIAAEGERAFYSGAIAREIVRAASKSGGVLTLADLEQYRVKWREPLSLQYKKNELFVVPPPSSGGVSLALALNLLEPHDLAALGHNSSAHLHLVVEALKHAFADRARHLGDPDFVEVPTARLTSKAYAAELGRRIGERTLPSERYGTGGTLRAPDRSGGTSHIAVVDTDGNAASLTTTINTAFGARLLVEGTGLLLNNEMDDFSTRPGAPNAFGLVQGEKNAIAPRKRPLSSMCPTIVTSGGRIRAVLGASGGPTIISGTLQVLLNVVDFDLPAAEAVSRSRVHHQWLPDMLLVETDLPRDVTTALAARGHVLLKNAEPFTAVQLVLVKDRRYGASDPRKLGEPAGY
jgi:gamma-glutamyltranspeptidase / glutathione hydrolase